MVWDKTCVMDKRMAFIVDYRSEDHCFAELCRRYGVSRRIGYKWRDRYEAEGPAGLVDRSRAPHDPGNALPEELAEAVLALRGEYPHWGPKKLRARLERDRPGERVPAQSTIGLLLARHRSEEHTSELQSLMRISY